MRKIGLLLVALISLSFIACSSDDYKNDNPNSDFIIGQWEYAKSITLYENEEEASIKEWEHECKVTKDYIEITEGGYLINTLYNEDCTIGFYSKFTYSIVNGSLILVSVNDKDYIEVHDIIELTESKLVLYKDNDLPIGDNIGDSIEFSRK